MKPHKALIGRAYHPNARREGVAGLFRHVFNAAVAHRTEAELAGSRQLSSIR